MLSHKNFPDRPKTFSGYTTFFRSYKKNFPDIPGNEKNFQEITEIRVFKSALWAKNAILMTFFTQEKGTIKAIFYKKIIVKTTRINFTYLKMSFKCFRFISNVNFVLHTNQRPFVFSKQQQ
jgi:hypothetical protein